MNILVFLRFCFISILTKQEKSVFVKLMWIGVKNQIKISNSNLDFLFVGWLMADYDIVKDIVGQNYTLGDIPDNIIDFIDFWSLNQYFWLKKLFFNQKYSFFKIKWLNDFCFF